MLHYVPKTAKVANKLIRPNVKLGNPFNNNKRDLQVQDKSWRPYSEKKPKILIDDWCFGFYDVRLKRLSLEKKDRPCFSERFYSASPQKRGVDRK